MLYRNHKYTTLNKLEDCDFSQISTPSFKKKILQKYENSVFSILPTKFSPSGQNPGFHRSFCSVTWRINRFDSFGRAFYF